MALNEDVRVDVTLENSANQADILGLSYTTTIVDLGAKHVEYFVRHIIIGFHELLQLASAHNEIFIGEGVWDIPANWTELSSVLHNGVEEAEAEEDFLINLRLRALFELFLSQGFIGLQHV